MEGSWDREEGRRKRTRGFVPLHAWQEDEKKKRVRKASTSIESIEGNILTS